MKELFIKIIRIIRNLFKKQKIVIAPHISQRLNVIPTLNKKRLTKKLIWKNQPPKFNSKYGGKIYIKQVQENRFTACVKKVKGDKVAERIIKKFKDIEKAIKFKNKINYGY